jgi:hypothetical protein
MTNLLSLVIAAMIIQESGGDANAKGDYRNGIPQAIGCLQIWPGVIADVNRISSKSFKLQDRYSKEKSIEIAHIYLSHYCTEKRLGHKPTLRDYAHCWNGGPNFFKKNAEISRKLMKYSDSVKEHYANILAVR